MEDKKLIEEARAEVENIQKDVQTQLATFEEADNEENKRLLADAREKLQKLIADTSQWLKENTDREKIAENMTRLRDECIQLLTITKEKAIEVSKNEEFRATLHSGKEFIIGSGRLIASGVAALIGFQSFVNIGVTTGLLPNTGVPLPFVSYGLTSMVSMYIGIGLVLNVGLQARKYGSGDDF